jgi:formylmethanofuran dehydrogenase subunit E
MVVSVCANCGKLVYEDETWYILNISLCFACYLLVKEVIL